MRAIGMVMMLLSAAPLRGPDVHGWHFIGFLMLVGGFIAFGYGRNVRRGGQPRF